MVRRGVAIGVSAAIALAAAQPALAAVAKPGTIGVIEVEYEMTSKGEQKRGTESQMDWHGKRVLKIAFEVVAGALQSQPVTLSGVAKGKNSVAARTGAAAQRSQKGANDLNAALKQCNKDKDCETRVAMSFMASPAGAQVVGDAKFIARETSGKGGVARYQFWSPAGANGMPRAVSGSYVIDQYSRSRDYDPACGKTQNICTEIRETKGAGPLSAEGIEMYGRFLSMQGLLSGGVVVDTADKVVTVGFPGPHAMVDVTEVVQSGSEGTKRAARKEPWLAQMQNWEDGLGAADLPYVEPMTELHGEQIKKVVKGYGSKITIRWRFFVRP